MSTFYEIIYSCLQVWLLRTYIFQYFAFRDTLIQSNFVWPESCKCQREKTNQKIIFIDKCCSILFILFQSLMRVKLHKNKSFCTVSKKNVCIAWMIILAFLALQPNIYFFIISPYVSFMFYLWLCSFNKLMTRNVDDKLFLLLFYFLFILLHFCFPSRCVIQTERENLSQNISVSCSNPNFK